MAGRRIQVQVFPAFRRQLSVPWLRRVAEQALVQGQSLAANGYDKSPRYHSLSLAIADDETVLGLNHSYRGLDETTDVLAFAFDHPGQYEGDGPPPTLAAPEGFVIAGQDSGFAGEVVVSYPQCERQAGEHSHTTGEEMALLITHGVLHLLGHDHADLSEEREMQALEQTILASLNKGSEGSRTRGAAPSAVARRRPAGRLQTRVG